MRALRLDWLIHELQDDLDYHYKINLIAKNEGFVVNKCFETVVRRAILQRAPSLMRTSTKLLGITSEFGVRRGPQYMML